LSASENARTVRLVGRRLQAENQSASAPHRSLFSRDLRNRAQSSHQRKLTLPVRADQASSVGAAVDASNLPSFQLRNTLPAGTTPTSIVTGDFDRDGKTDWVVSNRADNTLWFYRGRGDGTADLPKIIPLGQVAGPVWIAAADLRGIGILDLIVAEADTY